MKISKVILGVCSTALSKAQARLVAAHQQDRCFRTESFSDSAAGNAACWELIADIFTWSSLSLKEVLIGLPRWHRTCLPMQVGWETQVQSLGWKIPWRRAGQYPPVFLPGETQGQWNLAGYSPWCCKELDTKQQLKHFKIICFDALGHLLCLMFSELTISMVWYKTIIWGKFSAIIISKLLVVPSIFLFSSIPFTQLWGNSTYQDGVSRALWPYVLLSSPHILWTMTLHGYITAEVTYRIAHAHQDVLSCPEATFFSKNL